MTALAAKKKERLTHLDILRAIATVAVITFHVGNGGGYASDTVVRSLYSILNGWCVPSFVMLTGILFLESGKDLCLKKHGKRILRLLVTLLFWGFFYNILAIVITDHGFSMLALKDALVMTITADTLYCYHFWYLYMVIGLYLLLPVLNAFLKCISDKEQLAVLHIVILFSLVIPTVQTLTDSSGSIWKSGFIYFSGFVVYLLLGHRIERHPIKKPFFVIVLVTAAAWVAGIVYLTLQRSPFAERLSGYLSVATAEIAVLVFCFCKRLTPYVDRHPAICSVFAFMAKYSLPVYILHVIVVQMLRKLLGFDCSFAPLYISIPVLTVVVYVLSLLAGCILKRIPLLKNTL